VGGARGGRVGGGGGGDGGGAAGGAGGGERRAASGSIISAMARAAEALKEEQSCASLVSSRTPSTLPPLSRSSTTARHCPESPERSARASIESSASDGDARARRPSHPSTSFAMAGAPPQPSAPGSSTQLSDTDFDPSAAAGRATDAQLQSTARSAKVVRGLGTVAFYRIPGSTILNAAPPRSPVVTEMVP
jgi:hypothetical protein